MLFAVWRQFVLGTSRSFNLLLHRNALLQSRNHLSSPACTTASWNCWQASRASEIHSQTLILSSRAPIFLCRPRSRSIDPRELRSLLQCIPADFHRIIRANISTHSSPLIGRLISFLRRLAKGSRNFGSLSPALISFHMKYSFSRLSFLSTSSSIVSIGTCPARK